MSLRLMVFRSCSDKGFLVLPQNYFQKKKYALNLIMSASEHLQK